MESVQPGEGQEVHLLRAELENERSKSAACLAETERLLGELGEERRKSSEYLDEWRRSAADFVNYRRRMEQDQADLVKRCTGELVKALLPVLDNFGRALAAVPPAMKSQSWVEGVALTEKQLAAVLRRQGLEPIDAVGERFDPRYHEAVAAVPVRRSDQDGAVVDEVEKGYTLGDQVLRPTKVTVGTTGERQ